MYTHCMVRGSKSQGLNNDCDCITDRGAGRQTLVLEQVSRYFLAERCAEWRFTVGYAGDVANEYDNERLDPASCGVVGDAVLIA